MVREGHPQPARCRSCGARCWWVRLVTGRVQLVNHERILIFRGARVDLPWTMLETIVTRHGETLTGEWAGRSLDPGPGNWLPPHLAVGGRSHFATCPHAGEWRRHREREIWR